MVLGFLRRRGRREQEESPLRWVGSQSVYRRSRPDAAYARMGLVVREDEWTHHFPRALGQAYVLSLYAAKVYYGRDDVDHLYRQPWGAAFWVSRIDPERLVRVPGFELATLRDLDLYSPGYAVSLLRDPRLRALVERMPAFKMAAVLSTSVSDALIPVHALQAYAGKVETRAEEGGRRIRMELVEPVARLRWEQGRPVIERPRHEVMVGSRGVDVRPALAPAVLDPLSLREPPRRLLGLRDAADYARYLAELHAAVLNTGLPNDEAGGMSRVLAAKAAGAALERALGLARGERRAAVAEAVARILVDSGMGVDEARRVGERFAAMLEGLFARAAEPPGEERWAREPVELFPVAVVLRTALMETGRVLGTGPGWDRCVSLRPKSLQLPAEVVEGLPYSRQVLELLAKRAERRQGEEQRGAANGGAGTRILETRARVVTVYRLALSLYRETGLAIDPSEAAALLHAALSGEEPEKALSLLGAGNGPAWFYAKSMAETVFASLGAPVYGFLANIHMGERSDPGKAPMLASVYAELAHSEVPREEKEKLLQAFTAALGGLADTVSRTIADLYMEDRERRDPLGVMDDARFESPLTRAVARAAIHVISDVDLTGGSYAGRVWSYLDAAEGEWNPLGIVPNEYLRIREEMKQYFRGLAERGVAVADVAREARFFERLLQSHARQIPSPFYAELYTRVSEQALLGVAEYAENQSLHSPYLYEMPMDFLGFLKGTVQKAVARGIAETITSATMHLRGHLEEGEGLPTNEVELALLTGWIRDMPEIVANELREQVRYVLEKSGIQVATHPPYYSPGSVFASPPERKAVSLIKPYYVKALTGLEAVELPVEVEETTVRIVSAADGYVSLDAVKAFETLYWHSDEVYRALQGMVAGKAGGKEEEEARRYAERRERPLDVHEGA